MSFTDVDLSNYVLVATYDLPEPTRTTPPDSTSLLAQEASAVTYDKDTGTLFVVGDGGTSVVQVSLTGQLIDSMTLAPGGSPQGTEFYDTEGLTYVGDGKFVMTEERDRNAVEFTYAAGTTLTRADAQTVNLGTFVGNVGLEGVTWDPETGGFIFVKEKDPQAIFQTDIDFAAGTATNPATPGTEPTNLFNPGSVGTIDFSDVYALSNLSALNGQADSSHLLIISQESGEIVEVGRDGTVYSTLTIQSAPGNPLSVPDQQYEGVTMGPDGTLYITSENGGGDIDHPQLRVYAPSTAVNAAPTAVALTNQVTSIDENTSTASRIKIADVNVTDDGLGTNHLYLTGPDAGFLEVDNTGLYIKQGTVLDYETKTSYTVSVNVDDPSVGSDPDAVSSPFTLNVNNVVNENPGHPVLYISEVAPWSSGNSPVAADWFEVTNTGTAAVDITGWKMDDNSNSFGNAVALTGITSIAAGESVVFVETTGSSLDTVKAAFINTWFGGNAPAGLQVGGYGGSGVGLSTGGDAVNLYNAAGQLQAGVSFGSSAAGPFESFDNSQGLNNSAIADLSAVALHGAFAAANDGQEIGSPGTVGKVFISEVAPWASGNSPGMADWFEVTNSSAFAVDITGWKMDDNSQSFAAAAALSGITSIGAGESVIFIETSNLAAAKAGFLNTWFGSNPPPNLQIGSYSGSGVGLSTSSDAVNLYNASGVLEASVNFAASPPGPYPTFDNAAGLNNATISQLSANGVHGGFTAVNDALETGSPGGIAVVNAPPVASDDSLSNIAEDSGARSISFSSLLGNDKAGPANESAQALTIIAVGNAVGGSVAIQGGNVIFTPTADYNGPASFDYTVQDNGTSYGVSHFLTDVGTASFAITPVNDLPVITSPSGFFLPENHTAAGTVTATDGDHDALTFSLSGGADEALFTITGAGDLSFINPPDFETPLDAGHDNVYQVEVAANDGSGTLVTQLISVTVTDEAEAGLTVNGGNGDDVLNGTAGNDIVNAGNGADQIDAGDGSDNVSGGNGDDVIAAGHGDDTVNAGNNDDSIDGGLGNDNLGGSNGNDSVDGGTGNDVLDGGTGNDILAGGNGTDLISAGDGDDSASGDDGNDVVNGDAGDDILAGGNGNDQLDGGTGNDTLSGEDGADKLSGGDGDDVLSGGNGKDVLTGGIGADIFVFGPPGVSGGDEVTDFLHGTDRLEFSAADLGLAPGSLDAADLVFGTKATDHHGEFVYNQVNGKLSWDADGVGGAGAVAVATLDTHDALDHADFLLM